jgi:3-dehydroquinate synthetase
VKTAVIGDVELFQLLESRAEGVLERDAGLLAEVVRRCVGVKARVVGQDETEQGIRATLNLGHTVGHALEAADGYGRWFHGEAVSLGLVAAVRLGERLGLTPGPIADRIVKLQRSLGLPIELAKADLAAAVEVVGHDKKKKGSAIGFVVVEDIGCVGLKALVLEDLRELLGSLVA